MRRLTAGSVVLGCFAMVLLGVAVAAEQQPKPKHTIKEVMTNAHKSGLLKKVLADEATPEEKLVLLDHYISLVECTPPKGDMNSWQNLSGKLALASAKVAVGRDGALTELKAASNCTTCHDAHK
jgi:hypothetical protein